MAVIKSAYEKAMERFQDIKPDINALKQKECRDRGATLCVQKLQGEDIDIEKELSASTGEEGAWTKEGFGEALLAQITLPSSETMLSQIDRIKEVVLVIASQATVAGELLDQYQQLCEQYLATKTNLAEQMKAQYMQMMEQHGRQAQSAALESSFVQSMQKQMQDLESQFKPAVQKVKENLRQLCGFTLEK